MKLFLSTLQITKGNIAVYTWIKKKRNLGRLWYKEILSACQNIAWKTWKIKKIWCVKGKKEEKLKVVFDS